MPEDKQETADAMIEAMARAAAAVGIDALFLEVHATATQDGNTVTGETLTLKGAGGKIAIADGNVKLVYVPTPAAPQYPPLENIQGQGNYQEYRIFNWPGEPVKVASAEANKEIA